jgi:hypothetical protein
MAAVLVLEAYPELVEPSDLPHLGRLVRQSKTWAFVDGLAGDVLGELLVRRPEASAELDRWAEDQDFWVRRLALLAQIKPLNNGAPFARFVAYADATTPRSTTRCCSTVEPATSVPGRARLVCHRCAIAPTGAA